MRELESPVQDKKLDTIEIVQEQQQKKELKLVGSERKIRGHILFEFNEKSRRLDVARFKAQTFTITSLDPTSSDYLKINQKVDVQDNCIYIQALNRKNAIKQLKRLGYDGNIL